MAPRHGDPGDRRGHIVPEPQRRSGRVGACKSFATATGLNSVARQVGAALGVALIVAIIGTPSPLTALAAFQHAWTFGAVCLFVSGIGCLLVGRVNVETAPGLSEAARAAVSVHEDQRPARPVPPRMPRAITVDIADTGIARRRARRRLPPACNCLRMNPVLREQLAAKSHTRRVAAGRWLFREGDDAEAMFVVRAGRLEVVDERVGTVIRELGRGDGIGELALLTSSPRSASVRARCARAMSSRSRRMPLTRS